ncbi:XisH family protein [Nostoc sphaeroides CHAB 2801]|nr:XisH family protein [Nostoc sphaeroides CHAB 2801]
MPARDIFHNAVKRCLRRATPTLEKEGWKITHESLTR